jgi:hypothetical protein
MQGAGWPAVRSDWGLLSRGCCMLLATAGSLPMSACKGRVAGDTRHQSASCTPATGVLQLAVKARLAADACKQGWGGAGTWCIWGGSVLQAYRRDIEGTPQFEPSVTAYIPSTLCTTNNGLRSLCLQHGRVQHDHLPSCKHCSVRPLLGILPVKILTEQRRAGVQGRPSASKCRPPANANTPLRVRRAEQRNRCNLPGEVKA